jgi:hypothetical protein
MRCALVPYSRRVAYSSPLSGSVRYPSPRMPRPLAGCAGRGAVAVMCWTSQDRGGCPACPAVLCCVRVLALSIFKHLFKHFFKHFFFTCSVQRRRKVSAMSSRI